VLLRIAAAVAFFQPGQVAPLPNLPEQPEQVVRKLYAKVVNLRPLGIPPDADMKAFEPYLSQALLQKIALARSCEADWRLQHPASGLKPPGRDYGLFSGGGLGGEPRSDDFEIGKSDPEKDASFRVHVTLKWRWPSGERRIWEVIPIVVRDGGHFAVDDVTYPPGTDRDPDPPLSEYLSAGCDGSRWVRSGGLGDDLEHPEPMVNSLYQQVLVHRPVGIPWGLNEKIFAPYLSNALLRKMKVAVACGEDWTRQNPPPPILKAPMGWLELGTFSGGDDEGELHGFEIERTQANPDGSFRVYLKLTWGVPPENPWVSHVSPVVVWEDGAFVVDDVIYLKDEGQTEDRSLSQALSGGCEGRRWVGFDKKRKNSN
jgi:hypothetical protein